MKKSLDAYKINPEELHTLADVIKYTENTPEEQADKFGVDEWRKCEALGKQYGPESPEYKASMAWRHRIVQQIDELLQRTKCDLLFVPSVIDASANVGGCPTVAVSIGFYPEGTPVQRRESSRLVTIGPNIP